MCKDGWFAESSKLMATLQTKISLQKKEKKRKQDKKKKKFGSALDNWLSKLIMPLPWYS